MSNEYTNVDPAIIGYNSELLRSLAGWTRRELSEKTGICYGTIRNAELYRISYSKPFAMAILYAVEHNIPDSKLDIFEEATKHKVECSDNWISQKTMSLSPKDIFSENLRKIRLTFGLTQTSLAQLSGAKPSRICDIETKKRPMTDSVSDKLDAIFIFLSEDDPELRSFYTMARRELIVGDEPPKFSRPKKGKYNNEI